MRMLKARLTGVLTLFALFLVLLQGPPRPLLLLDPTPSTQAAGLAWAEEWQAESAFYRVWSRADEPVAGSTAARSWMWGPVPFAVANEPYAESPSGLRLVEYLDKARMEVNDTSVDQRSPWYVTTGLRSEEH